MKKALLQGILLAALAVASSALAQTGWKSHADLSNICQVSAPADWERRQGEIFIKDTTRQVRMMVMYGRNNLGVTRSQVRDSIRENRPQAVVDSGQLVVYRYQGTNNTFGAYIGYYAISPRDGGVCKLHKMVPAEMAPMFDDLLVQIARTLRAR